jgi:hypothetical protein
MLFLFFFGWFVFQTGSFIIAARIFLGKISFLVITYYRYNSYYKLGLCYFVRYYKIFMFLEGLFFKPVVILLQLVFFGQNWCFS